MAAVSSLNDRRSATGTLPHLPLPTLPASEIPRAGDGISPSMSSVNTSSSQSSQPSMGMYGYGGGWNPPASSSYQTHSQPQLAQNPFSRSQIYQSSSISYNQRNSQSPGGGSEGLPATPYEHQAFPAPLSGGGHGSSHSMTSGPPPTPTSATSQYDSYAHRPHGYYASSPPGQHSYQAAYTTLPSPTQATSATNPGMRGMPSLASQSSMSPIGQPGAYRFSSYSAHAGMPGPVMSNMHQPGNQMSMIPGMTLQGYPAHMSYGQQASSSATDRPFKCEHCIQAFSRNHDLKRHKRIHLSVKPFSCSVCGKSFSRKDALKRHRLVKGCDKQEKDDSTGGDSYDNGSPILKKEM